MKSLKFIADELILAAFAIGAIKIRPDNPFTWASGWKSPIYNDNRMLLFYPDLRKSVIDGLETLCRTLDAPHPDVIAGTSTAGIPHGYGLAERLKLPFIYIRDKPKDHGMKNQIEGIDAEKSLEGKTTIVIEDLISTGGSSAAAVQAVRTASGVVHECYSIFSYGFPKATAMFKGEVPFKGEEKLSLPCHTDSIIRYPELIEYGVIHGHIKKEHQELLHTWSADPERWSEDWKAAHL